MRSVIELANSGGITADELKMLMSSIGERVNETHQLLDNLLNWARTQMQGEQINPTKIDFHALVNATTKLLGKQAEDKEIVLENKIAQNSIAFADADMMSLVLRNLISNAIKFTDSGGEIMISSKPTKEFLQITVADNGNGISGALQAKLFDIRENFSTSCTAQEKGTGLGLGLCKDCVEKNHGRIWVASKVGNGSKFHFTIPTEMVDS